MINKRNIEFMKELGSLLRSYGVTLDRMIYENEIEINFKDDAPIYFTNDINEDNVNEYLEGIGNSYK